MTTYDDNNQDNEPLYVSIYDKKPRKTHVFTAVPLTIEEKRIRACLIAKKHYYNHSEEIIAKNILYRKRINGMGGWRSLPPLRTHSVLVKKK